MKSMKSSVVALGMQLHSAVLEAREAIAIIPVGIDLDEEIRRIDAASQDAHTIAEQIMSMVASTAQGRLIKRMAAAWLDGTYPKDEAPNEHDFPAYGAI